MNDVRASVRGPFDLSVQESSSDDSSDLGDDVDDDFDEDDSGEDEEGTYLCCLRVMRLTLCLLLCV